jgi:hypothetical protein
MLVRFLGLPHGFELLEGNIRDQYELPYGEWAMSRNAIHLGSHIGSYPTMGHINQVTCIGQLFYQVWHILLSPSSKTFVDVSNGLLGLSPSNTKVLLWDISKDGKFLV